MRVPQVQALLICERIIRDHGSHRLSLINIFADIGTEEFPATFPEVWVYCRMINAVGRYNFTLRIVKVGVQEEKVMDIERSFDCPNPAIMVEASFQIAKVMFREPALYEFRMIVEGETIGQTTLRITRLPRSS